MLTRRLAALSVSALVLSAVGCGARSDLLDNVEGTTSHASRRDSGFADGSNPSRGDASRGDANGGDATVGDATGGDATVSDTGRRGADAGDTGPTAEGGADAGPPLNPDERVAGSQLAIVGVTDHGLIIYGDAAGTCWALAFMGGPPRAISPATVGVDSGSGPCAGGLHGATTISHDVVFMNIGASLYTWTAAMGTPALLPPPTAESIGPPSGIASVDSHYVAYSEGYLPTGVVPMSVANVDGSQSQVLGGGTLLFTGPLAVYGSSDGTGPLVSLNPAHGWSKTTLAPEVWGFAVDALGEHAIYDSNAGLTLTSLDSTTQTLVTNAAAGPYLYLAPDASFAAYYAGGPLTGEAIEAVNLPGGTPRMIAGLEYLNEAYPQSVRAQTPAGPVGAFEVTPNSNNPSLVVVALGPGATFPSVVLPNFRAASDYEDGDGFTEDGAFVLALGSTPESTTTLVAVSLAGGPGNVALTEVGYDARALRASRVLYHDNYQPTGNLQYQGTADLRVANLAAGTGSALVVSNVDAYFGLSPDRTSFAYTINRGTSADGLYVMTLPTAP